MVSTVSGSSGTITSTYSNLMRVNGMASGMDVDSMVSQMMKAQSLPLDQMKQKQQLLEWQRDDYRSMYTSLNDLDQTIFNGIYMQSTFNKKSVTSSDDSKVSATAVNATGNMSAQIGVTNLATSASWKSTVNSYTHPTSSTTLNFTVTDPGNTPGSSTDRTVPISISATDGIDSIISKFNSSNLGVTMFKDSKGYPVMTNNKTGAGGAFKVDSNTKDFMKSLGFTMETDTNGNDVADANGNYTLKDSILGADATITFNSYTMNEKSNTFTINGISYTIKGQTSEVNISTTTDVDSIYNAIKTFVDKYNDVIKTVNDKISEKRNRDYKPLTDDQRNSMTETQITKWEDKAKSGMLSNDTILSSGLDKMRQDLYTPVSGNNGYSQLSQIGITTSSDYTENGKLIIDETTLRQKIQENPQAIYQLFNGGIRSNDTPASGQSYSYATEGIAKRLRDSLYTTENQIVNEAGKSTYTNTQFAIGKELNTLSTQISDFQKKLSTIETRYYNQFTAMEQAMQTANQQSTYVSSMFSGG